MSNDKEGQDGGAIAEGVFRATPEGRFLSSNQALADILGYRTPKELMADVTDIGGQLYTSPEDRRRHLEQLEKHDVLRGGVVRWRRKDRTIVRLSHDSRTVRGDDGEVLHYEASVRDITKRKRAEEALRENEELLRLFISHTPAAVAMFDTDMRYLEHSRRWLTDYGVDEQDVIGRLHYEVFPDTPERWKAINKRCLAGAVEKCEEDTFVRADGTIDWVRWETHPWRKSGGEIGGIITFSEVITKRKQTEEELKKSEDRFSKAFHASPISIAIARIDDGLLYDVNAKWLSVTGYERDEVIGKPIREVGLWADLNQRSVFVERIRQDGSFREFEAEIITKSGDVRTMLLTGDIIELDDEPRLLVACTDITERKRAEAALRESEERFRGIFETSAAGIVLHALDGGYLTVNQAFCDMLGYSEEEFLRMNWRDITHPDDVAMAERNDERLLAGKIKNYLFEKRYIHKDGSIVWVRMGVSVLRDGKGNPMSIIAQILDITERKRAEEALRESEARAIRSEHQLTDAIESIADGVVLYDADDRFVLCNSKFLERYSEVEELLVPGTPYEVLINAIAERGHILQTRGRVEEWVRERTEIHRKRKDPIVFQDRDGRWILIHDYKTSDGGTFTIGTDITELKRTEGALSEAEENYRRLFESSPEGIFQSVPEGHFINVNPALVRMLGYDSPKDFLRRVKSIERHFYVDPTMRAKILKKLKKYGRFQNNEAMVRCKDGTAIWISENARAVRTEGKGIRHFEGTVKDITERKNIEIALQKANKLSQLGRASLFGSLTRRESEIYSMLIKGRTNKVIAEELGVSARTVEFHRANIKRKLNVSNLAEMIVVYKNITADP